MDIAKRPQYYGLDIAKLIAAVFVIASHTYPLTGQEGTLYYRAYDFFLYMAVPLFALISGYLVCRKLNWKDDPAEDIQVLKKALFGMIRLYLLWNLIYFPIAIQEPIPDSKPMYLLAVRYVVNLFFVGEQFLSWQLWYLLANIYGLLLLIFLRKWTSKVWLLGLSGCILFVFSCWLTQFINAVDQYTGTTYLLSLVLGEVFINGRLFSGISYILAGVFLARLDRTPAPVPCFILLALQFWMKLSGLVFPSLFLQDLAISVRAICLFVLCLQWQGTRQKACYFTCRRISTVFYFTHMLWFYVGYALLDPLPTFTFWGAPAFFWCLLGSAVTALVVLRFPNNRIVKLLF